MTAIGNPTMTDAEERAWAEAQRSGKPWRGKEQRAFCADRPARRPGADNAVGGDATVTDDFVMPPVGPEIHRERNDRAEAHKEEA